MQTYTLTYTLTVHDPATLRTHLAMAQATEPSDTTLLELLGSIGLALGGDVGCEVVDQWAMPCKERARPYRSAGLADLERVSKPREMGVELERVAARACARCGAPAASACTWCDLCLGELG